MAGVKHPSLLRITDSDPESKWYVSEYYPGGTLDTRLQEFSGNALKAMKALRPVVEAVAELHRRGIVHRDIKPHNIFVASDGRLVLGISGSSTSKITPRRGSPAL